MARVYKFAQKEYGISAEKLTFTAQSDANWTFNGRQVMDQVTLNGRQGDITLAPGPNMGIVENPVGTFTLNPGAPGSTVVTVPNMTITTTATPQQVLITPISAPKANISAAGNVISFTKPGTYLSQIALQVDSAADTDYYGVLWTVYQGTDQTNAIGTTSTVSSPKVISSKPGLALLANTFIVPAASVAAPYQINYQIATSPISGTNKPTINGGIWFTFIPTA